jgi:hypothetical protein
MCSLVLAGHNRTRPSGSDLHQSLPTVMLIADVAGTENLPGTAGEFSPTASGWWSAGEHDIDHSRSG